MEKTQHQQVSLKNLYAFIDPTAKGVDRGIFHLFVVGKENLGIFIHNGKKFYVDELKHNPQKIVYYVPRVEKNIDTKSTNGFYAHASNNIAELLTSNFETIKGIEKDAIEAMRPLLKEYVITLNTCRKYENLFACVQKREKNNKFHQTTLIDFCQ